MASPASPAEHYKAADDQLAYVQAHHAELTRDAMALALAAAQVHATLATATTAAAGARMLPGEGD